ncbi:ABC transporter G family member 28-like [Dorcoceras hygrometricum]|nr:ABC transporter G family member 28-like [Dorcoceras hygrometricum]
MVGTNSDGNGDGDVGDSVVETNSDGDGGDGGGVAAEMKKAAGALSVDDVISSDITISRKLMFTSRCYLELAIAKRCRLHKLIRQRFALAIKIQQMLFALITSSRKIPAGSYSRFSISAKTEEFSRRLIQSKAIVRCISSRHRIQQKRKEVKRMNQQRSS